MWGWVGQNIWESFRMVVRGKVSAIAFVIVLDALPEMIWLKKNM